MWEVILAVVKSMGDLVEGRSRLIKLVFLLDYVSREKFGRRVTGYDWVYHFYGPYSRDLMRDLHGLVLDGWLDEWYDPVSGRYVYRLLADPPGLGPEVVGVVEEVVREYGSMDVEGLKRVCYGVLDGLGVVPGETVPL